MVTFVWSNNERALAPHDAKHAGMRVHLSRAAHLSIQLPKCNAEWQEVRHLIDVHHPVLILQVYSRAVILPGVGAVGSDANHLLPCTPAVAVFCFQCALQLNPEP